MQEAGLSETTTTTTASETTGEYSIHTEKLPLVIYGNVVIVGIISLG